LKVRFHSDKKKKKKRKKKGVYFKSSGAAQKDVTLKFVVDHQMTAERPSVFYKSLMQGQQVFPLP